MISFPLSSHSDSRRRRRALLVRFVPVWRPLRRGDPGRLRRRPALRSRLWADDGAVTAEYAIVIMAAVSFAGVLVAVLRSGRVQSVLTELVQRALTVG